VKAIVETNFLLELALEQRDSDLCEAIVDLAERKTIGLIMPGFCIAEAYMSLSDKHRRRSALATELETELRQIDRSRRFREEGEIQELLDGQLARSIMDRSRIAHVEHLDHTLERMMNVAAVIPFDRATYMRARESAGKYQLEKPGDAAVCASVLMYLEGEVRGACVFVEKDRKDFSNPDLQDHLASRDCAIAFNVGEAFGLLRRGDA
jgi:hypothetical protein